MSIAFAPAMTAFVGVRAVAQAAEAMEGVANRRGYRTHSQPDGPWIARRSATAPGTLWLAGAGPRGPFYAATDHGGVAVEIPGAAASVPHPGVAAWRADTVQALDALVDAIYRLSVSLPAHPLALFQERLAEEPARPTETEASRRIRIGQDVFRAALLDYWGGACPLTGIREAPLLRAFHIRPWAECDDAERLDVHNGLLLSALWDAAFNGGLVSFANDGQTWTVRITGFGALRRDFAGMSHPLWRLPASIQGGIRRLERAACQVRTPRRRLAVPGRPAA